MTRKESGNVSDGLHRRPALASFLEEKAVSGRENTGADLEVRPGYGYLNLRGDPGDERFMQAVRETLGQPLPALANTFTAAADNTHIRAVLHNILAGAGRMAAGHRTRERKRPRGTTWQKPGRAISLPG